MDKIESRSSTGPTAEDPERGGPPPESARERLSESPETRAAGGTPAPVRGAAWDTSVARLRASMPGDAIRDAQRYVRLRYYAFIASMAIVFGIAVAAGVVLAVSLLGDTGWEQRAISGAVAGVSLLILILLQYRPAKAYESAASQLAQLEATRAFLDRSLMLWDGYVEERRASQQLTAEDITRAVLSMATASRSAIEAQQMTGLQGGKAAQAQKVPSPVMPDPRRY